MRKLCKPCRFIRLNYTASAQPSESRSTSLTYQRRTSEKGTLPVDSVYPPPLGVASPRRLFSRQQRSDTE